MSDAIKSIVDFSGAGASLVNVECHISSGLPSILIIGHATKAVDEAKERLRASFASSGMLLPKKRITINLSPADIQKDSTSLDLAMAVSILTKSKQIDESRTKDTILLGELALDGGLNPVRGLIGRILHAKSLGYINFYIPTKSLDQALLVPGIKLKAANSLRDVFLDLSNTMPIASIESSDKITKPELDISEYMDFSEIAEQPLAKRALEIAAAGHHNILLYGPPGTGKTMLAKAMCGILPDLEKDEILEVTQIHSLGGGSINEIVWTRPFRSPHHTASTTALIGGGTQPKPGEASLAHKGVLFLDEFPEFTHSSLEALRQPLEDGKVTVSRVRSSVTFPADFILVATQNPCPCGYFGTTKPCSCSAANIAKYEKKISGPISDRIDLHIPVNDIDHSLILSNKDKKLETPAIKQRVSKAYDIQKRRFGKTRFNSSMTNKEIITLAQLDASAKDFLDSAAKKLNISARAYVRTLRVARTIADLNGEETISTKAVAEALQYRKRLTLT